MSMRAVCAFCPGQAYYAVSVPGAAGDKAAGACGTHVDTAVRRMGERSGTGSVTVWLLERGMPPQAPPQMADVTEQVRRIAANSRDRKRAHLMEDRLHLAVLAMIAQGAEGAADLAAAALQSQRFGFERVAG